MKRQHQMPERQEQLNDLFELIELLEKASELLWFYRIRNAHDVDVLIERVQKEIEILT